MGFFVNSKNKIPSSNKSWRQIPATTAKKLSRRWPLRRSLLVLTSSAQWTWPRIPLFCILALTLCQFQGNNKIKSKKAKRSPGNKWRWTVTLSGIPSNSYPNPKPPKKRVTSSLQHRSGLLYTYTGLRRIPITSIRTASPLTLSWT